MAEQIPVQNFEHQSLSFTIGAQRYQLSLRWNDTCEHWAVKVSQNGNELYGFYPLQENRFIADAIPCFPASWGGLYLEVCDPTATGMNALISGAHKLWAFASWETYAIFGTIDAP